MQLSRRSYRQPHKHILAELVDLLDYKQQTTKSMSTDRFTEVTNTGWFSQIGKSIVGVLLGLVLTIGAFPLLWWNEGRSVKTYQGLLEGEKVTVEVSAEAVDAANDGKLVHTIGKAEAKDEVRDDLFGVASPGMIKLQRKVELYQWVEKKQTRTKNKMGGGEETVTEYTYEKKWDADIKKSDEFKIREGHVNPPPAYQSNTFTSNQATLGAFRLPEFLINTWRDYKPLDLPAVASLPEPLRAKAQLREGWLYLSASPDQPELGDARVKFDAIPAGEASVLARQLKDTFEPYTTKTETKIARIASGAQSKEAMFAAAKSENKMMTWIFRGLGCFLMFLGLVMVLAPFKVLASVLPIAGRIVGAGVGFIAFLLSAFGSTLTISLAWLWYRPVLGSSLLCLTLVCLVLLIKALRKKVA